VRVDFYAAAGKVSDGDGGALPLQDCKFRFKNKLMSLNASVIELSVTMFDWAKYTQQKGAIKLRLLLDRDGYLPSFAVVTEGKYSELNVARDSRLKAGTILAVDRGYKDYVWFGQLTMCGSGG
jgi:hypothetical protein